MIVEIRPKLDKWHGNKGSKDIGQPQKWPCAINPKTNQYDVELSDEDIEIFQKANINVDTTPKYDSEGNLIPHPTWDSRLGLLKLPNSPLELDTEVVLDRLKIAIAKRCPLIAPSEADMDSYPAARFFIHSEEMDASNRAEAVAVKRKAMETSFKLTQEEKTNLVWVLRGDNVVGKSEDFINVIIDDMITKNPTEFLKYATLDKTQLKLRGLVAEAVHKGVLIRDAATIKYGSEILGISEEDAVAYLMKDKNQPLRLRIEEMVSK